MLDKLDCLKSIDNGKGLVFTSEETVNEMLNLLPGEVWSNKNIKLCDPSCKSGVFLREAYKRFDIGLKDVIIDDIERNHWILTNMLYGVALNELCQVISSTTINCKNIVLDENEFKDMKFDVIIGNPPYNEEVNQSSKTAKSLYHKFIIKAIESGARYVSMIVPAKWYTKDVGYIKEFRKLMCKGHIKTIYDYKDTKNVFGDNIMVGSGIMYFLYDKDYNGECQFYTPETNDNFIMQLSKYSIVIRDKIGYNVLSKVQDAHERMMDGNVSISKFNLNSTYKTDITTPDLVNNIRLYTSKCKECYISADKIKNANFAYSWNVFVGRAGDPKTIYPSLVTPKAWYAKDACCTSTYMYISSFDIENEARNCCNYINTKFVRFIISLFKAGQDVYGHCYSAVPVQDFTEEWTDEKLYKKYNLTQSEIDYIEWAIRDRK